MTNIQRCVFGLAATAASMMSFVWYLLRQWFPVQATRWEARWFQRSSGRVIRAGSKN